MFWIGSGLSLALSLILAAMLPSTPARPMVRYGAFMRSLLQLPREAPALLGVGLRAGMFFGAFIAFWTTLVFFFLGTPPYHYGSQAAGMFGLVGAVGAPDSRHGREKPPTGAARVSSFAGRSESASRPTLCSAYGAGIFGG